MKKIIILVIVLITADTAFSQQANYSPTFSNQDYLQKSKKQKTAAWILVSAGALSSSLGSIRTNPDGYGGGETTNSNSTVFLVAGLTAIGASVALFIASAKNKKKAMSLSFKNEPFPQLQKTSLAYRAIPSLGLKISL